MIIRNKVLSRQCDYINKNLKNSKITIFGCGGLGSNIAFMLARAGVSQINIFDYDKVDYSNLNRQNYEIKDLGQYKVLACKKHILDAIPYIKINAFKIKLNENNLDEYIELSDVFIEAFDDKLSKTMLFDYFLKRQDKKLICASGVAGLNYENIKSKNFLNIKVIGDFCSEEDLGLYSPKVNLIASIQAIEAIKLLIKGEKHGQI